MDELALLKDMANDTPLPSATDLAPARARLTAALTEATAPPKITPLAPRRRRRLLVSGVTAVGLAAAITAVVSFGGLGPGASEADAGEILHQAADAARKLPATPPRPDQFVYTKSGSDGGLREAWLSTDGTHDGLIEQDRELDSGRIERDRTPMPGCRDGQRRVMRGDYDMGMFEPCTPWPAYRADLPRDAAGMRAYLSNPAYTPDGDPQGFNRLIHAAFVETYVPPETLAALFEVMADFPGLTVDEDATDAAGRHGIGVSWTLPTDEVTLIFDPETHALLGYSHSDWSSAVIDRAIVDAAGQRP